MIVHSDFKSDDPRMLEIEKDETVYMLTEIDGWILGVNKDDKYGFFPGNYANIIDW